MAQLSRCLAFFALSLGLAALASPASASSQDMKDQAAANYLHAAAVPMQAGDLEEAGRILEEGLKRATVTPELLTLLGSVYRQQGRLVDANEVIDEALRISPSYAPAHLELGDIYRELGLLETAADSYRNALKADEDAAAARYRLVDCLAEAGQLRAAEQECRQFLAVEESATLCLALGETLEKQQQFQEALAAYDRAIELDERCADAHSRRAGLFCELGQYDAAMEASRAALEINPSHADAHGYLGLASAHSEDYMGAYSHAVKAQKAGLDMSEVWSLLQNNN